MAVITRMIVRRAWLPKILSNGDWVWLQRYTSMQRRVYVGAEEGSKWVTRRTWKKGIR
jgi:hypothetical protein